MCVFFRNRTRNYQKLQNDFTQLTHSYSSLQQDVKALVGQISAMEKTFRNLKEEKGKLEEEIVRLNDRHHQQDSLMLQRQSDNAAALEALQKSWNEKRASYVVYMKRQSEELEEQKNRILVLSGKERELRKNQRRHKTKVRAVVAELVAAVNAGSSANTTLLHLTKWARRKAQNLTSLTRKSFFFSSKYEEEEEKYGNFHFFKEEIPKNFFFSKKI